MEIPDISITYTITSGFVEANKHIIKKWNKEIKFQSSQFPSTLLNISKNVIKQVQERGCSTTKLMLTIIAKRTIGKITIKHY